MARMSVGPLKGGPGGPIWMKLRGLDQLQNFLEEASGEDLDLEMEQAVQDVLEEVKEASQAIVPYDTGRLHDSAEVFVARERGQIQAAISYDTEYAVYVHENPDAHHAPPTQWKFLEQPFVEALPTMTERISRAVREQLR